MLRLIARIACAALATAGIAASVAAATPAATGMTQFQHDLVSVLALRADAEHLLGAALLARTLPDPATGLSYHALLGRAAASPDAGPVVTWAQLVDCSPKAMDCPNPQALARLEHEAPDNAAVWLMALGQAQGDGDAAAAHAAWGRAAAATQYDDYRGASLKALAAAAAALPPPADLYTGADAAASSAAGVRALLVFGLGNLQPIPGFQAAAAICAKDKVDDATRRSCLKLAHTLAWAGTPL
ncbi:MAG TPA: hypothetical protein VFJ04_00685, partial [Rhodanobacteraceae bacterium]|nr:hypothetical protein [Rhodanobacteraceae bacterium]